MASLMLRLAAALLALVALAAPARAEVHGLVLWIADYAEPSAKLRGIGVDAELARAMMRRIGVAPERLVERSNDALGFDGLRGALLALRLRLKRGDTAVIYFSGHGKRRGRGGAPGTVGCQEGLVAVDGLLYLDVLLRMDLEDLAAVAGRVIMFNDSCHAGGAVIKGWRDPQDDAPQPKAYPLEPGAAKGVPAEVADAACAAQVNVVTKALRGMPASDRLLYLAAAAENEAAFATREGSIATRAWHACLHDPKADADGDGRVTGDELNACAQGWLRSRFPALRQTLTPQMNRSLPVLDTTPR